MGIIRKLQRAKNSYFGEYIDGIKHYNFNQDNSWLGEFIRHHFEHKDWHNFSLVSVFGSPRTFWFHKHENKIFFTGENPERYPNYKDNALPHVKLSLGFDYLTAENYLRFPLWIMYLFDPKDSALDIRKKVADINNFHPKKTDFCSLICRHGGDDNLRGIMCDQISQIAPVMCAGSYRHNDDRLWQAFGNHKHQYLSNFKFSICPENSNRRGYVTEKLFETFKAGAIPIYWGSDNDPEPGLINPKAMVLWNNEGDNTAALAQLEELQNSDQAYQRFLAQPRFTPEFAEYVISRYQALEHRLHSMLK